MDTDEIVKRLAELIGKLVRGEANDHDKAELQLLQRLRIKKLMPRLYH